MSKASRRNAIRATIEPLSALAFKLMTDPYVGQLTFIRVYSGTLKKGDAVWNPVKGKKERIGRIVLMQANDRHEVDEAARRGYRGLRRSEGCDHRRYVMRPGCDHYPRTDGVSGAGDFRWPLSRRPKRTRRKWASRCSGWRRKIRRSVCIPMKSPAIDRLSPAWVGCIWRSLSTG